jgi:hypothetical protein
MAAHKSQRKGSFLDADGGPFCVPIDIVAAAATPSSLSAYVPIVLAHWDRQDRIVVQLVQRKIPWGEAVLRLKASRTVFLTDTYPAVMPRIDLSGISRPPLDRSSAFRNRVNGALHVVALFQRHLTRQHLGGINDNSYR